MIQAKEVKRTFDKFKKVLLVTDEDDDLTQALLFQIAIHFSSEGHRVFYIAPQQIDALPPGINEKAMPTVSDVELITFMYLKEKDEVISSLSGLHKTYRPPRVIIIQNMEHYAKSLHDGTAIAAIASRGAITCGIRLQCEPALFVSHRNPVPPVFPRSLFNDIWCIHRHGIQVTLQTSAGRYEFEELDGYDEEAVVSRSSYVLIQKVFHMFKGSTSDS